MQEFHRIESYSERRPGTQWSDRCGGLSCARLAIRCLGTVCDIADKMWCWHRPSGRRAAGARPCGVQLPENKKNVPENNNKTRQVTSNQRARKYARVRGGLAEVWRGKEAIHIRRHRTQRVSFPLRVKEHNTDACPFGHTRINIYLYSMLCLYGHFEK